MKKSSLGLIVENIRLPISCDDEDITRAAIKKLSAFSGLGAPTRLEIYKRSVDARKKESICFVCSVYAQVPCSENIDIEKLKSAGIKEKVLSSPEFVSGNEKMSAPPVVIGFGPAGMFSALLLAKYGYRPIVLERGGSVNERVACVSKFYEKGELTEDTNIQFGAGGAGTFSDGKLTTRINDPYVHFVLETLRDMGAPEDVVFKAKPHIGTDVLRKVVENFHREIERFGGMVLYNSKVTAFDSGFVVLNGEKLQSGATVAACGHSARDIYRYVTDSGFAVEPKPFSVGVRIEHLQRDIDRAMYGREELAEKLGHAEYALSLRRGERGVYTFCMCPGGTVVAAASERGGVVTNGMSEHSRDGRNANAAIAVSVLPSDYGNNVDGAVEFQRQLERAAFENGGRNYFAPCQSVGDFLSGKKGKIPSRVAPSYMDGKVTAADFNGLFPEYVSSMLKAGITDFGKKIKGFDAPDIPLTGVETRTSAPMRILRNTETLEAIGHEGVYPCGEGAGYAGGIVSAAVDGLRVAGKIIEKFRPID